MLTIVEPVLIDLDSATSTGSSIVQLDDASASSSRLQRVFSLECRASSVPVSLFVFNPVRLEREYSVSVAQVRETQVFVCARATLDRRIALDLKRVVGF